MAHQSTPRVIAFYLPQIHTTPANDESWRKSFAKWSNLAKTKQPLCGHFQSQVSAELDFCPRLSAPGRRPVGPGTNELVGETPQHQDYDVSVGVHHIHQQGGLQSGRQFLHRCIAFQPTVLKQTAPLPIDHHGLARPHPGINRPKGLPQQNGRGGGIHTRATPVFAGNRARPLINSSAIEVEVHVGLDAQYHRKLAQTKLDALPMSSLPLRSSPAVTESEALVMKLAARHIHRAHHAHSQILVNKVEICESLPPSLLGGIQR